jgi:large subunit ribosomal protein L5
MAEEAAVTKKLAMPRLQKMYREEVAGGLHEEFKYKNVMEIPTIEKITINMGLGEAVANPNLIKTAVEELTVISGQRAVITRAKKSIATFKLREGMPIGCMVTLRGQRMWEFLDRLVTVALPRTRDFKGISGKAFDGRGNYTLGLKEQTIFQEIEYDKLDKVKGMNVCFVTSANTDEEGKALLKRLGMPFKN